jgi:lysophospholipase L1-like esterase
LRRLGLLLLAAGLLAVAHQTMGPLSVASFAAAWLALLIGPPLLYWIRRRQGGLSGRQGNFILTAVVSFACLQILLTMAIGLRGEFHRPHSHRDENVAFHAELGHAPILQPGDAERGVVLAETIGQRLRTIDGDREQIVIIGDSVLHGWRLDDEQVVDAFLAPSFPENQVLNISVSGYSISQYYLYLREHLHRTRPKVVVVGIYAGNDYESSAMSNWSGHTTPLFVMDRDGIRPHRPVTPRFNCIDILSGSLLFKPLWRWFDMTMGIMNVVCNVRTLEEPEHGEVVHLLLQAIEALVTDQGAKLLYVLLPDANDFNLESWYVKEKSRLPHLRKVLARGDYHWIDFYDNIAAHGGDPRELYQEDDSAHYNEAGMRLLARTLEPEIRRLVGAP